MNILVTGSNGQLGSEIRSITTDTTHKYIFTDVAELDITNLSRIRQAIADNAIDVVINCAAYTNVDGAESDETKANLINNMAVCLLATVCKEVDATLIHISTDYVFDGRNNIPYTEEMATKPIGVYGRTKLAGERAVINSGCRYIIIRTSWLYSRFGNNFVKTMQRLTAERDTLNVVFDQVGTPTYAADLAQLIVKIIDENMLDKQGIYHFSNEGVCSWYDFAVEISRLSGNSCVITPCHSDEFPSKVKRPHFSVLDKHKVKQTFEAQIAHWKISLEEYFSCLRKEIDYKAIDTERIVAYIKTRSLEAIPVSEITNNSGAETLRVVPILFELEQEKVITVTERSSLGAPKMIRLNIDEVNQK